MVDSNKILDEFQEDFQHIRTKLYEYRDLIVARAKNIEKNGAKHIDTVSKSDQCFR